ncbi:hypothetical protein D3C75_895850 [compost metagenome]
MHFHPHEAFQPVGHGRLGNLQECLGDGRGQFVGGFQRCAVLAKKHRRIQLEVVAVASVEGVEIQRPFALQEFAVGDDGPAVGGQRGIVVAAQHIDVRGHVSQVPGIRHQVAQGIAGAQGPFRVGRHFHGVDVHVQHARMWRFTLVHALQGLFQYGHCLQGIGTGHGGAALEVPQLPGCAVDQRLGKQRGNVDIVAEVGINLAHRLGIRIVAATQLGRALHVV